MKKILLIAAVMTATVFNANAQSRFDPGTVTLQPRIGGTAAQMTNTPNLNMFDIQGVGNVSLDAQPTGGGLVGLELEYQITDRFSVAAGVNYAQAGSGWKDLEVKGAAQKQELKDIKIETSYVNVPITANFYIAKGLALKTGVQFGFLTKSDAKCTAKTGDTKVDVDKKIESSRFNKFDVSIPVGLSYEFKTPGVSDLRYNIGLTKVNKEKEEGYKDMRNGVVSLTVGYKFKL